MKFNKVRTNPDSEIEFGRSEIALIFDMQDGSNHFEAISIREGDSAGSVANRLEILARNIRFRAIGE